jgi:hypothetical protein
MRRGCPQRPYSGQMRDFSQKQSPSDLVAALSCLAVQTFFYSWNWKAALLSASLRAPLFLVATLRHGLRAISIAVLVEALYSAFMSGCFGAFVQKMRNARPLWASALLIVAVLPALLLWFDYRLHLYTGMPNLKGGMWAAATLCVLSSLFNWYLMKHGNLLVGRSGRPFVSDLKRMPGMVFDFVALIPRYCYRHLRSTSLRLQA